jgi:threonine dehydrogenase-like Zn-dependent dehydrogenase
MSGGKSSSTQQQLTTQIDQRAVLGEGAIYAKDGGSVNVTTLDPGVVARALDTVDNSLKRSDASASRALDTADSALSRAMASGDASLRQAFTFGAGVLTAAAKQTDRVLDTMQATQQLTADAYNDAKGRGALTDKILIAAVGGALVVAAFAVAHD